MKYARHLGAIALAAALGTLPSTAHAATAAPSVPQSASAWGDSAADDGTVCSPTTISRDGWTLWRCVGADGTVSWPWKAHLGCTALGGVTGLLFTPMTGAVVGVTCRILIPTPAYSYLPVTPIQGFGGWSDSDFGEQGGFEYNEYRYDASTDEYWMEVTSDDYPLSDSYRYRFGHGTGCPNGERWCGDER